MKQNILRKLPPELIINILLGLPVRSIITCKCVCKSLLKLVESREFGDSYLSKSTPFLAFFERASWLYKIYEIKDLLNLEYHELHYHLFMEFSLLRRERFSSHGHVNELCIPFGGSIRGSADGLLLLVDTHTSYICNPITRDYVELHYSQELAPRSRMVTYGFGASKITGQYKVVRIFKCNQQFKCQVYTLGTRSWRRIDLGPTWERIKPLYFNHHEGGAFVNGNLHWLLFETHGALVISCFDLETELFSTLSLPIRSTTSLPVPGQRSLRLGLSTLCDCLCICDDLYDQKIVIWLMKEYGVEKSWTVEYVVSPQDCLQDGFSVNSFQESFQMFCPIKVMKDGDILMAVKDYFLFFYSNKTKTLRRLDIFEGASPRWTIGSILLTQRFISLKNFVMEDVKSFDDPV